MKFLLTRFVILLNIRKIPLKREFMKNTIFLLSICFFITACGSSISIIPDTKKGDDTRGESGTDGNLPSVTVNNYEKQIFLLVNKHRKNLNKIQLKWHDQAIIESQDHSQDMASFRVPFGHIGFNKRISIIKAKDTDTIYKSGENVAQNSTAQRAFEAWLRSPGHRRNIEGDFTHTGIGSIRSANGSWYFTQIFLKK